MEILRQSCYINKWRIISMFTERRKNSLLSSFLFEYILWQTKVVQICMWKFILNLFFRECRKISLSNHCYIYSNKNSPCLLKINKFSAIIFKWDTCYLKCDRRIALYKLHNTLEAVRNIFVSSHIICVCIQNLYSIIVISKYL